MARSPFPDALAMRRLKFGEASPSERLEVARRLRAAGRRAEAILLFEREPDASFLREEIDWAITHGQAFHLLSLRRLGAEVTESSIRDCARAAEREGRLLDAVQCYKALGDEGALARLPSP